MGSGGGGGGGGGSGGGGSSIGRGSVRQTSECDSDVQTGDSGAVQ